MFSKAKWLVLLIPMTACVPEHPVMSNDQVKRQELFSQCLALANTVGSQSYTAGNGDHGIGDIIRACEDSAYYQSRYCVSNCNGVSGKPWGDK